MLNKLNDVKNLDDSEIGQVCFAVVAAVPPEFLIVEVNAGLRRLLGNSTPEIVGRPFGEIVQSLKIDGLMDSLHRAITAGEATSFRDRKLRDLPPGSPCWTGSLIPVLGERGEVTFVVCTLTKTSGKTNARERFLKGGEGTSILGEGPGCEGVDGSLREAEGGFFHLGGELEAFDAVAKASVDAAEVGDIVRSALDKAMEMLGAEMGWVNLLDEATGRLRLFVHRGVPDCTIARLEEPAFEDGGCGYAPLSGEVTLIGEGDADQPEQARSFADGVPWGVSIPLRSKDVVLGVMNLRFANRCNFSPQDLKLLSFFGVWVGTLIENTMLSSRLAERTQEARIKALQVQSVLARSANAQEDDRKRIARDIHDGMGQLISGALLQIEAMARSSNTNFKGSGEQADLTVVEKLLKEALNEVPRTLFNLDPPIVELGLVPALQKHLSLCQAGSGFSCHLQTFGSIFHLPSHVETAVYRIIQEAVQNVDKHTEAADVHVILEFGPKSLRVTIQDNGMGFPLEDASDGWHLGLISMQERALSVGGKMEIKSFPGYGAKLILEIPQTGSFDGLADSE